MGDIINAGADLLGFGPASKQADAANNASQASLQASREATALQKSMYDQTRADNAPFRQTGLAANNRLAYLMGVGPNGQAPTGGGGMLGGVGGAISSALGSGGLSGIANGLLSGSGDTRTQAYVPQAGDQYGSLFKPFGMSDFQQDPGYGFRMSEGIKALDRSASARGGLLSGAALKGITRYGQDMGSQEYGNAYNRYNSDQSNQYNRLASMAGLAQTANGVNATAGQSYANSAGNNMMTNAANQGNASIAQGNIRASQYNNLGSAINSGMNYNWNGLSNMFSGSQLGSTNDYAANDWIG
jgi:hypothetical protein